MRRALATLFVLGACALAVVSVGAGESGAEHPRYWIEFDTAFGLVENGDVRVAGVNAGLVKAIELDKETLKARVQVEITQTGYGSFRSDAFCEVRPQSPLGEYFIDCDPGRSGEELPQNGTVRVERTATTIPNDLVLNMWRLPYRERLRLIIAEFGAGLAGRGEDLNEAIRRAVPALRQTDRVLAILASEKETLRRLVTDADTVLEELAGSRRHVGRWVEELRDTASASAERRADIAENFRRLPDFLGELEPTLARLETLTDEQTPVLRDLNASAGNLRRFFDNTADFSDASLPSLEALADAADTGRGALRALEPRIRELREYARRTPDVGQNARIVLEDFADPDRAVERDPRSPGGRGFSGLQALLRYVFSQSIQANAFDLNGYISRAAVHTSECAPYDNARTVKQNPERTKRCRSWLGPNQPGVTTPDPSPPQEGYEDPNRVTEAGSTESKPPPARTRRRTAGAEAALDFLLAP